LSDWCRQARGVIARCIGQEPSARRRDRAGAPSPDEQIATLDRLARAAGTSRAAMIREAVSPLLEERTPAPDLDAAFGLWAREHADGLAYQQRVRDEWPG